MRVLPPLRRGILLCEVVTAAWCLYAISFWYLPESGFSRQFVLPIMDLLLKAGAALVLGVATLRERWWAPTGVVVFAAYMGLPTVVHVGAAINTWAGPGFASTFGSAQTGWLTLSVAQLIALCSALRLLKVGPTAA